MRNVSYLLIAIVFFFIIECILSETRIAKQSITTIPYYTGQPLKKKSHTGYLLVKPKINGHLWFWFFESDPEDPVAVWLNGGPGCSSMIGLLRGNGPFRVESKDLVIENEFGWNTKANMLYIDQPVGVGLSYCDNLTDPNVLPKSSREAAEDMFTGLKEFYKLFPEYKDNDLYLTGESFAGKYIPYLTNLILQKQKEGKKEDYLNLKGILMGNAMLNPEIQYYAYPYTAYVAGLISYKDLIEMNALYLLCTKYIKLKDTENQKKTCTPLFTSKMIANSLLSPYDYRKTKRQQLESRKPLRAYLIQEDVREALGVDPNAKFLHCNRKIFRNFRDEFHLAIPDEWIPEMLKKIRVVFYSGQFDLRCGVLGTNELLRRMKWEGRDMYNGLPPSLFRVNGEVVGQFKTYLNLTHIILYGCGHIAVRDKPQVTQEMFYRFIKNESYCTGDDCRTQPYECPHNCSGHGQCVNLQCNCFASFEGKDCSIGRFKHKLDARNRTYTGTLHGRGVNIYQFELYPLSSLMDIDISLNQTSETGLPFIFVNISESKGHSLEDVKAKLMKDLEISVLGKMRDTGFMYANLSYDRYKEMHIIQTELRRGVPNTITIAVYNDKNVYLDYIITVRSKVGSGRIHLTSLLIGITALFSIILLIEICILCNYQSKRKLSEKQEYQRMKSEEE